MEEDTPAEEHLPGIVGLTVDHAGLVSDEKFAEFQGLSSSNGTPLSEGESGERPRQLRRLIQCIHDDGLCPRYRTYTHDVGELL